MKELSGMSDAELIDRSRAWIRGLCAPRGSPEAKSWTMRIPAESNDPDLLWDECLKRLSKTQPAPKGGE